MNKREVMRRTRIFASNLLHTTNGSCDPPSWAKDDETIAKFQRALDELARTILPRENAPGGPRS